jgi:basic membrane lipoprotein Med (substrate-binding protein (PBP1-ABC) superfamily)
MDQHNKGLISDEVLEKVNKAKEKIVIGEIKVTDAMAK